MGSWSHLYIAGYPIAAMKSVVDPAVMTIFSNDDRKSYLRKRSEVNPLVWGEIDDDEEETAYEYRSFVREVAERLDIMGFTMREAEVSFAEGVEYEAEIQELWNELDIQQQGAIEVGGAERSVRAVRYSEFLRGLEFGTWLDAVRTVLKPSPDVQRGEVQAEEPANRVLAYVRGEYGFGDEDSFGFPNAARFDLRIVVRALLEAVNPEAEVTLDYTDLVGGGWYSEEDNLRKLALQDLRNEYVVSERLIVLTEGFTDAEVLMRTLEVRYPHLKDYVSFPDFHGSNAEGGAGALANLVKAFASSGVPNRVVALFDNDAAGDDARRKLDGIVLPDNVRVLALPTLEYAKSYPTVGPQGKANADVNGRACSLELYFGRDVLEDGNGTLTPVEWSSRVRSLDRYQGAVMGKAALRKKYLDVLSRSVTTREAWGKHDWEPMELVFKAIFGAFEYESP